MPQEDGGDSLEGLPERIRAAARFVGGVSALAKRAGIPLGTLNGYLAGRKITAENLVAIADATDVSLDWLARGGEYVFTEDRVRGFSEDTDSDVVYVPRLDIRVAAGDGRLVDSEHVLDRVAFPSYMLRRISGNDPKHLVLVTAVGDSMEPTVRDGEFLLIDGSVEEIEDPGIYVVVIDGVASVKRVQRQPGGRLNVKSDNPVYEPTVLGPDETQQFLVAGRVRAVWRPL